MYRHPRPAARSREPAAERRPVRPSGAPVQLLNLQRSVGNRVIGDAIQRAKDDDQREAKHRRTAYAKAEIPGLAAAVSPKLADHCFAGKPLAGGEVTANNPQGLHGYTDRQLPQNLKVDGTEGSPNKVHRLRWHWEGGPAKAGGSTMLPRWMPKNHGLALIALARNVGTAHPADVRQYIQHGLTIRFTSKSENTFPTL